LSVQSSDFLVRLREIVFGLGFLQRFVGHEFLESGCVPVFGPILRVLNVLGSELVLAFEKMG
jgi:hypothetical protein